MAKDTKYIRKRKRKYGSAFLVDIPYFNENNQQQHFTKTIKINDFDGDEKTALLYAQKIRNDALQQIHSGVLKKTYPTVLSIYQQKWNFIPLSINTRKKQDAIFSSAIDPLKDKRISDITTADIQTCVNTYAESHSDDAVQRLMTIWRQIFKTCTIIGYEITDKTTGIIVPRSKVVSHKREVQMNQGDFITVLGGLLSYSGKETYNNRGIWYMLQIMYYTGCRPAEALALTAQDIQPDYIVINKMVGSTTKLRCQIVPPKTESSIRRLPIPPNLRPILNSMIKWSRHDFLLADEAGNLRDIDEISNTIHLVAKKYKVHFNAYMLRHLMSTELLHKGDSVVARDLLGHTSFSMTLDYARSTDRQIYNAIKERNLAENQPKNKNHERPPSAILHKYQILRFTAVLRICMIIKGYSEK